MNRSPLRALLFASALLQGCTFAVHSNHTSDYRVSKPIAEYRVVEARGEQIVLMGFAGNTDYVDTTFRELMNQCIGGHVTGVQTRHSTSHGFFSWTNVVLMKGYCSNAGR